MSKKYLFLLFLQKINSVSDLNNNFRERRNEYKSLRDDISEDSDRDILESKKLKNDNEINFSLSDNILKINDFVSTRIFGLKTILTADEDFYKHVSSLNKNTRIYAVRILIKDLIKELGVDSDSMLEIIDFMLEKIKYNDIECSDIKVNENYYLSDFLHLCEFISVLQWRKGFSIIGLLENFDKLKYILIEDIYMIPEIDYHYPFFSLVNILYNCQKISIKFIGLLATVKGVTCDNIIDIAKNCEGFSLELLQMLKHLKKSINNENIVDQFKKRLDNEVNNYSNSIKDSLKMNNDLDQGLLKKIKDLEKIMLKITSDWGSEIYGNSEKSLNNENILIFLNRYKNIAIDLLFQLNSIKFITEDNLLAKAEKYKNISIDLIRELRGVRDFSLDNMDCVIIGCQDIDFKLINILCKIPGMNANNIVEIANACKNKSIKMIETVMDIKGFNVNNMLNLLDECEYKLVDLIDSLLVVKGVNVYNIVSSSNKCIDKLFAFIKILSTFIGIDVNNILDCVNKFIKIISIDFLELLRRVSLQYNGDNFRYDEIEEFLNMCKDIKLYNNNDQQELKFGSIDFKDIKFNFDNFFARESYVYVNDDYYIKLIELLTKYKEYRKKKAENKRMKTNIEKSINIEREKNRKKNEEKFDEGGSCYYGCLSCSG